MLRQPAKVLEPADVRRLLRHVRSQRYPTRNRVMVLLSFKAGLRACEISGLQWQMVLDSSGKVAPVMLVSNAIAKMGSGRRLPVNAELRAELAKLHRQLGTPATGPIICSERGSAMTAASIVNWFGAVYRSLGMTGCSSHSGRRTFITNAARLLPRIGGSLRDVQELAGHRAISTTERYIQGNRDAQRKLIDRI